MGPVNVQLIPATAVSSTTAYASLGLPSALLVKGSIQGVMVSTATGTLKLQYSNDPQAVISGGQPTNWSDIPSASVSVAGAGVYGFAQIDLCYAWIRAVYTNATNSGTVSVQFQGLGI